MNSSNEYSYTSTSCFMLRYCSIRDANTITKTLLPHGDKLPKHEALREESRAKKKKEKKRETLADPSWDLHFWNVVILEKRKEPFFLHIYVSPPSKF